MSKPSRRANREIIKQNRRQSKKAAKQLLQMQRAKGLAPVVGPSISNAKSRYQSEQEEKHARQTAVSDQHRVVLCPCFHLCTGRTTIIHRWNLLSRG